MPATLLPSTSVNIGRSRKDVKHRPSPYYYRSKFLLAPDASSLVQPSWSDASVRGAERKRVLDVLPADPYTSDGSAKYRLAISKLNLVAPSPLRIMRSKPAHAIKDGHLHSTPAELENSYWDHLSLPPPPTLADILRMEPDLSPISAMRRAGDINPESVPSRSSYDSLNPSRVVVGHEPYSIPKQIRTCDTPNRPSPLLQPSNKSRERIVVGPSRSTVENLKAMAIWVSDYLYDVVVFDTSCSPLDRDSRNSYSAVHSRMQVGERLFRVLMAILPSTSAVMLALWYLSSLPTSRPETGNARDSSRQRFRQFMYEGSTLTIEDVIVRAFVAGSMLADKFMSDSSFSAKSWQSVSHIPLAILNGMELSALAIFGFSVQISPKEWQSWLKDLRWYHSSVVLHLGVSPYTHSAYDIVGRLLDDTIAKTPSHHMPKMHRSNVASPQSYDPAVKNTSNVPPPSSWCFLADEVTCRPDQTSGVVSGAGPAYIMLEDTLDPPHDTPTSFTQHTLPLT